MRVVIDRLGDRYGNSGEEKKGWNRKREREKNERGPRSRVASYLDKLSFFAVVLPRLFLLSTRNEKTGEHWRPWKRKRDFENRSLRSLSLSLESISRRWIPRASTSIALIVERKVDEAREMARLAPFHALNTNDRRSNSFHDFEINRLSWRDKYNGVNSISSLRFDCHCEIALLLQWNFAINEYREYSGIKFRWNSWLSLKEYLYLKTRGKKRGRKKKWHWTRELGI